MSSEGGTTHTSHPAYPTPPPPILPAAFFRCAVCSAEKEVEIDRGRIAEPVVCTNCSTRHSMALVHNRCLFTDKQMVKLQEAPGQCCTVGGASGLRSGLTRLTRDSAGL